MRVVVTRVSGASVSAQGSLVSSIDSGLLVLVGFTYGDNFDVIDRMIRKLTNLRIFSDSNGVMNLSILDVGGEVLSVSQFTLYGDTSRGNRPNYMRALNGGEASILYDYFNSKLSNFVCVKTGVFGAHMDVSSVNDGPVTIIMDM